jgi:hypothetical protein
MIRLADNQRREQEFTMGESRSRLRFGVKPFYPQMCVRSNRGLCCHTEWQCPQAYGFAMGISNCR